MSPALAGAASKEVKVPVGSVPLAAVSSKKVGKVSCARVGGAWLPGSVVFFKIRVRYFVSHTQQERNYVKAARAARSSKPLALKYSKLAANYRAKAKSELASCKRSSPLKLTLKSTVALAVKSPMKKAASAASATSSASTVGAGSNLAALLADGKYRDPVISGNAENINDVIKGPRGEIYLAFNTPINLSETAPSLDTTGTADIAAGRLCTLAKLDETTGTPSCIDAYGKDNHCGWWRGFMNPLLTVGGGGVNSHPAIQITKSGVIYYVGADCGIRFGRPVLRRYDAGVESDLTAASTDEIVRLAAVDDGTVLVSGFTPAQPPTQPFRDEWVRMIKPNGEMEVLASAQSSFLQRFPDGNAYFGLIGGVTRYVSGAGTEPWIGGRCGPVTCFGESHESAVAICAGESASGISNYNSNGGFCGTMGGQLRAIPRQLITTSDDRVFGLPGFGKWTADDPNGFDTYGWPILVQYYPTLRKPPTVVEKVRAIASCGTKLAVAGTNSGGTNVLMLHDIASDDERELLGSANEVRIDHLDCSESGSPVVFDGRRLSDGKLVAGSIDTATGSVLISSTAGASLSGLTTIK